MVVKVNWSPIRWKLFQFKRINEKKHSQRLVIISLTCFMLSFDYRALVFRDIDTRTGIWLVRTISFKGNLNCFQFYVYILCQVIQNLDVDFLCWTSSANQNSRVVKKQFWNFPKCFHYFHQTYETEQSWWAGVAP